MIFLLNYRRAGFNLKFPDISTKIFQLIWSIVLYFTKKDILWWIWNLLHSVISCIDWLININIDNIDALITPIMTYLWSAMLNNSGYVKRHEANEFALHRITRGNRMPSYYITATGISLVATRAEIIHAKAAGYRPVIQMHSSILRFYLKVIRIGI